VNIKLFIIQETMTHEEHEAMQEVHFKIVVISFMYVMIAARPNLAMVVGTRIQFMHRPQRYHWQAAKRILCYLQGTKDYWLQDEATSDVTILAYW
jgi:hypothetical protein